MFKMKLYKTTDDILEDFNKVLDDLTSHISQLVSIEVKNEIEMDRLMDANAAVRTEIDRAVAAQAKIQNLLN